MGLFDKKTCDICGEKSGLLGNRKLEDGNMCSSCAKKLSPFTTDRRKTTLIDIKAHLAYRETNKADVAAFNVTGSFGDRNQLLIDANAGKFIVTSSKNWQNDNPDVINISQITNCSTNTSERKTEIMRKDKDGKMVSYSPRQYKYEYDFYVTINVNSPFFDEIKFKLNTIIVDANSGDYMNYERQFDKIRQALSPVR